jgi:RNA polymerase sigma-70 factor (ECF subfamily)
MFTQEAVSLLPVLHRICISILHSEADAQDAAQQALTNAWMHKSRVSSKQFRPWLIRIAVNECRNIQRYRKRVAPSERIDVLREATISYTSPDSDLAIAVETLPEKLRTPLLLKYMEQYTEREIAHGLGISLQAVKNRLFRARRTLEKNLCTEVTFE